MQQTRGTGARAEETGGMDGMAVPGLVVDVRPRTHHGVHVDGTSPGFCMLGKMGAPPPQLFFFFPL